jgi:hypothetical protein
MAGVQPHFSQARVFPLVRRQLRGPGVAGYIFCFVVITSGSAKRRLGAPSPASECPSDRSRSIYPLNSSSRFQSSTVEFENGVRRLRAVVESGGNSEYCEYCEKRSAESGLSNY